MWSPSSNHPFVWDCFHHPHRKLCPRKNSIHAIGPGIVEYLVPSGNASRNYPTIRLDEPRWWKGRSAYSTVSILKHSRLTNERPIFGGEMWPPDETRKRQIKIEICSSGIQINIGRADFPSHVIMILRDLWNVSS
jgi:hypothetical protein